jgi:hypothetical protein
MVERATGPGGVDLAASHYHFFLRVSLPHSITKLSTRGSGSSPSLGIAHMASAGGEVKEETRAKS